MLFYNIKLIKTSYIKVTYILIPKEIPTSFEVMVILASLRDCHATLDRYYFKHSAALHNDHLIVGQHTLKISSLLSSSLNSA